MQSNSWDNYPLVLNTKQVAEILSISTNQVYAMLKEGTLPRVQIGRVYKVYRDALRDWLSRGAPV
ncbi:hypothetical protein SPSPH_044760 [Sporomusa sphaeroides DSM 2875]|uniref:Helix-turn-helix domain protein n=2 Tax=Sporomusa TaxID=2375 RepID=A0ABM9W0K8_9FIRM|nr:helix-turn-helix domain protein [Sporomusa sphaeroides DSM 2875]CVK18404.1 Helix-turn-helix domain protein [Sporomusa sphaeroides DSM 2875]